MTTVSKTLVINHDIEAVWPAVADFGGVYKFHPRVERSPLLSDQLGGVGARRRCEFVDGNAIVEEVTGWTEGRAVEIEIVEGSMPLKRASGRIELEPLRPGKTQVKFSLEYVPKFGPLGWLMNVMMMRREFEKLLGQVLDGLDAHLSTGAVIGEDGRPLASAA